MPWKNYEDYSLWENEEEGLLKYRIKRPKVVEKGWGHELWIENKPQYCGKLLFIKKGKKCSWHYHKLKDEVFYLQSGKICLTFGETDNLEDATMVYLNPGESFHVPVGLRHQMYAYEDSELFEFSTEHFDSDSHRVIKGD